MLLFLVVVNFSHYRPCSSQFNVLHAILLISLSVLLDLTGLLDLRQTFWVDQNDGGRRNSVL